MVARVDSDPYALQFVTAGAAQAPKQAVGLSQASAMAGKPIGKRRFGVDSEEWIGILWFWWILDLSVSFALASRVCFLSLAFCSLFVFAGIFRRVIFICPCFN